MARTEQRQRVRVRVNPIRCTAFGFCHEFCPELFAIDEWGYAWLRDREAPGELLEVLQQTADLCPTDAIIIEVIDEE
jgi:ferredoxin